MEEKSFLKWAGIIVIIIVALLLALSLFNVITLAAVFSWLQHGVYRITGMDPVLAKATTAAILALIVSLPIGSIILSFTPFPQENKGLYRASVFVLTAAAFLFIYFSGKNTFFDPTTGKPTKYYIQYPNGEYRFSTESGYDPITGEPLKPMKKEVALKVRKLIPESPIVFSEPKKSEKKMATHQKKPKVKKITNEPREPDKNLKDNSKNTSKFEEKYEQGLTAIAAAPTPVETAAPTPVATTAPSFSHPKCLVIFSNYSNNTLILSNKRMKELSRIPPHSDLEADMRPGNYYISTVNGILFKFKVPDNEVFKLEIN